MEVENENIQWKPILMVVSWCKPAQSHLLYFAQQGESRERTFYVQLCFHIDFYLIVPQTTLSEKQQIGVFNINLQKNKKTKINKIKKCICLLISACYKITPFLQWNGVWCAGVIWCMRFILFPVWMSGTAAI